jgi:dTDP-4-amino-4,6-dideoxygalactose transaminase
VHARHIYTVWCDGCARDDLMTHLLGERIGAVVNYRPIHLMSYFVKRYGYRRGDFPIAEWIGDRTVSLPFYPDMPLDDVDIVAQAVQQALISRAGDTASLAARAACRGQL